MAVVVTSKMASKTLLLGWIACVSLIAAHEHHRATGDEQQPFIGWTQEDLDAKWGTDVSTTIRARELILRVPVGLQWHIDLGAS